MARFTPEQTAANEQLQSAMENYLRTFCRQQGALLVDWVVVLQSSWYDDDGDRCSAYHMAFSTGEMDEHRAIGLLEYGKDLVLHGEAADDD